MKNAIWKKLRVANEMPRSYDRTPAPVKRTGRPIKPNAIWKTLRVAKAKAVWYDGIPASLNAMRTSFKIAP